MALPDPGEIYWLRPEEESHDKDARRPHVVVSPADQNDTVVTLALGTKSELQKVFGAPHITVQKSSAMFAVTGLRTTTHFYPSQLVVSLLTEMPRSASGRIVDEFPALRDRELPRAVGLAKGGSRQARQAPGRRGQIAQFTERFAALVGMRFGVVISHRQYSLHDEYQNVVPIVDADVFAVSNPDFCVADREWLPQLAPIRKAAFIVQLVQSVYDGSRHAAEEERDVLRYFGTRVDSATMARVDEALAQRLFGARLEDVAIEGE